MTKTQNEIPCRLNVYSATTRLALALTACLVVAAFAPGQAVNPTLETGLHWRNIGPFRAGRVSAVAGVPGDPATYYMGLPEGGVWKTTSAGQTWFPVFDAVRGTSCVGSVQVAPSNPNIVYAGTGEISAGGEGDGIYRSDDAGATWRHLGLEATKMIPTLLVDPHDPDLVLAAACGPSDPHSDQRGVYRSTDGGKTWTKTLYIDDQIGVQHLAWAYDNPSVVFATSERRSSGMAMFRPDPKVPSGTALYKSADEGVTWTKLVPRGLPRIDGRCCVAVAEGTQSERVFLIGTFGLYRSDDGGATWRQVAANDFRIANGQGFYTSGVYVDPKNPDIVYTLATCMYRSLDGGQTFEAFKGAPGGDDPQQLWIDPTNGNDLLLGGDQGAVVSLDAGQTWGSWYNQPTGQFYHIAVTNDWPYWVYGTQQDSGSIGTSSRGNLGAITPTDWTPHPGSEGGPMVADPLDPRITYCEGAGGLVRVMFPSGQWTPINPPNLPGEDLGGLNTILFSPANPHELLAGYKRLMESSDRGAHWRTLSPDLTAKPDEKPAMPSGRGFAFRFASISAIAPSPMDDRTIWVGTTNGLLKLTRDHGVTWETVALPKMPPNESPLITSISAAPHDLSEAYVAVAERGADGNAGLLFRTRDFGATWSEVRHGEAASHLGRAFGPTVKCDPKKGGLLFWASGDHIATSLDDGDQWLPLDLNLPTTVISDLVVHGDDLVLSTFGRGIWILDDFSPLRELSAEVARESVHLFKPAEAIRVRRNLSQDTPYPPEVPQAENPPPGALIDYSLSAKPSGTVTLDILDRNGQVVRHMSSNPVVPFTDPKPAVPDFWFEKREPLPTAVGLNRVNWNVRYDTPPAFFHDPSYTSGASPHHTPFATEGPLAPPGRYTARLTVDGKTFEQKFEVRNDPRTPGSQREIEAMHVIQLRLYAGIQEAWNGYHQVATVRDAVARLLGTNPDAEVVAAAHAFDSKLAEIGGSTVPPRMFFVPQSTANFVGLDSYLIGQLDGLDYGDIGPTEAVQRSTAQAWAQAKALADKWRALSGKDLANFNTLLAKHNLPPIPAPVPTLVDPPPPPKQYLPPPAKPAKAG